MLVVNLLILLISLYLIYLVSEKFFIGSLEIIAKKLKLSPEITGATFMAVGSSAPEFFTMLFAVFRQEDIGAGTIIGSAIFNILVIVGVSSIFVSAKLLWQPVIRDLIFYSISILVLLLSFQDGVITLIEAILFVLIYLLYIFIVAKWQKWLRYKTPRIIENEVQKEQKGINFIIAKGISVIIPKPSSKTYAITFTLSILFIGFLSHLLVDSSIHLGEALDISPTILGLTVLAAGTSIPDLLSSVIVARKGKGDMAVSNAVGSNIFDILFGLGVPWLLYLLISGNEFYTVENENLMASVILLFATVVTLLLLLVARKWKLGKFIGYILISLYIVYIGYTVFLAL